MKRFEPALYFSVLLFLTSCSLMQNVRSLRIIPTGQAPKLSLQSPHIRGVIQEIFTPNGKTSGLFVLGKKEIDTSYDKAMVGINEKTCIFNKLGTQYLKVTDSDLQVGQTVEVFFTGPIATSYPVQAFALEIAIIQGGP